MVTTTHVSTPMSPASWSVKSSALWTMPLPDVAGASLGSPASPSVKCGCVRKINLNAGWQLEKLIYLRKKIFYCFRYRKEIMQIK